MLTADAETFDATRSINRPVINFTDKILIMFLYFVFFQLALTCLINKNLVWASESNNK